MAFNSDTYHANKSRNHSRQLLARAREAKATGNGDVQQLVRSARLYASIARTFRPTNQAKKGS